MPAPIEQLLSRTVYATDGTTVNWDFSFASGYLDAAHVKAQTRSAEGAITQIVVTPGMLIGEFQLQITPALASGLTLTIYRDTPKNAPLVDFNDESGFSEIALDTNAKQAVMVAAEAIDTINSSDLTAAIDAAESAGAAAAAASASAALAVASVASIGTAVTDAEAAASAAIAAAASINPASFATAAQGAKADSAVQPSDLTVASITDATSAGRAWLTAVDAAAQRVLLGLTAVGSSLVTASDAAAVRVVLALGGLATKTTVATSDIDNASVTAPKLSGQQTGSAPVYGARAWCVFNGTLAGTNAPKAGGNVASVQRVAVGTYVVNFVTPMPDVDYCIKASGTGESAGGLVRQGPAYALTGKSTASFTLITGLDNTTLSDWVEISVSIMR